MKTKVVLILLSFSMFFISCKNESKNINENVKKEGLDDFFSVSLDVKVNKSDDFQMYYIESQSENFSEEKSIWVNINANENQQKVVFNLPKDVLPYLVRFDFGLSDSQEDITLYSIEMDKWIISKKNS
jgi:hypothetical protein